MTSNVCLCCGALKTTGLHSITSNNKSYNCKTCYYNSEIVAKKVKYGFFDLNNRWHGRLI